MQGMQSRKAFSPQQTAPYSLLERNIFSLEISKIHWKKTRLLKLRLNISEHKDRGAVNLSNMKSAPYSAKEGDPLVKRWQLSHSSAWYLVEWALTIPCSGTALPLNKKLLQGCAVEKRHRKGFSFPESPTCWPQFASLPSAPHLGQPSTSRLPVCFVLSPSTALTVCSLFELLCSHSSSRPFNRYLGLTTCQLLHRVLCGHPFILLDRDSPKDGAGKSRNCFIFVPPRGPATWQALGEC